VPERRALTIVNLDSNKKLTDHQNNSFLILIPVIADSKSKWTHLFDAEFPPHDLQYIREILRDLQVKREAKMITVFSKKETNESTKSDPTQVDCYELHIRS
jgi:hypothetical protein